MGVIEKILEEIDEKIEHVQKAFINNENMPGCLLYKKTMEEAKDIIRKHMNDAEYPYITEKDVESVPTASKEFLAECREVAEKYGKNDGWTSVDERLPEDVYTSSELHEKWFLITNSCGEEKLVQRMRCVPSGYVWHDGYDTHRAVAWRYIEPYKPERSDNHDGE